MPIGATSGYDLVLQVAENALDTALKQANINFPNLVEANIDIPLLGTLDITTGQPYKAKYKAKVSLARPTVAILQQPGGPPHKRAELRATLLAGSALEWINPLAIPGFSLGANNNISLEARGFVSLACDLEVATIAGGKAIAARVDTAMIDFTFNATLGLTLGTYNLIIPILLDANTLKTAFAPVVTVLKSMLASIKYVPLTVPIPVGVGASPPTSLRDLGFSGFTAATPPAANAPHGIAIGLLTQCGAVGNEAGLAQNPGNITVRLQGSNGWLVCLVCSIIEGTSAFLGVKFTVNMAAAIGTWTGSVGITASDGSTFTLTSMTVSAPGGAIIIAATGAASGFCWNAAPTFTFTISFTCDPATGALTSVSSTPSVSPNVSIPWYCILIGAVIAALLFGLLAGIIVALVLALAPPLSFNITAAGASGLFDKVFGAPLPIPVGANGINLISCVFDDLEIRGTLGYADQVPTITKGTATLATSDGFDLDTGTTGGPTATLYHPGVDLAWSGTQLSAIHGAEIASTTKTFATLSFRDLQGLSFAVGSIPTSQIPSISQAPLVFGARTTEGRYAKCAVRKTAVGALELQWVTYQQPSASLDIEAQFDVTQEQVVSQSQETCRTLHIEPSPPLGDLTDEPLLDVVLGIGDDPPGPPPPGPYSTGSEVFDAGTFSGGHDHGGKPPIDGGGTGLPSVYDLKKQRGRKFGVVKWVEIEAVDVSVVDIAQRATFRADARLLNYPLVFRWIVFGFQVPTGTGTVVNAGLTITYDEDSVLLEVTSPLGVDLVGQVCCTAIDADGRGVRSCIAVNKPGRRKRGGGCANRFEGMSFADFQLFAREFGRIIAGAQGTAKQLRSMAATAAKPQKVLPARSLRDALRDAAKPQNRAPRSRGGKPRR